MRRFLPTAVLLLALALPSFASAAPPTAPGYESLTAGSLRFHFRAKDEGIAAVLAARGPAALSSIASKTGIESPRVIDVVLSPTFAEFAAAQPGTPPSWAAGTAYWERGEVYLRSRMPHVGADPIDKVFVHELVHVVLGRAFGDREIPRWLNEGSAKLFAGEMDAQGHATLVQAALGGALLDLEDITHRWPRSPGRAGLAYAQSSDFVAYLADRGEDVLPRLIAELSSGVSVDAALERATGQRLSALEDAWRGRITFWHALLPVIGGSGVTWGAGALIFLIAAFRRRRAFHTKVSAMEAREAAAEARRAAVAAQMSVHTALFGTGWSMESTPLPQGYKQTIIYTEPGDTPDDEIIH
ncbi:MAG: hypothetical protein KDA24_05260 [Deltaproteobacteria bacterium]|nr:hypothetical protein [Deltaproteobacteria bacterium]